MTRFEGDRLPYKQSQDETDDKLRRASQSPGEFGVKQTPIADNQACEATGKLPLFRVSSDGSQQTVKLNGYVSESSSADRAEQVAWDAWQQRLNHTLHEKMKELVKGQNFPEGLSCTLNYEITNNARATWESTSQSGNARFDAAINKTMHDVFKYHPELLKFPAGSKRTTYSRQDVTFTSGVDSYQTAAVDDEVNRL